MKKVLLITALFLLSFAGFSQTSISITNNTGLDFYDLYSSDEENPGWGDDLLPYDLFYDQSEVVITFPAGYSCYVDISTMYESENGSLEIIFYGVDICSVSGIVINSDGTFDVY